MNKSQKQEEIDWRSHAEQAVKFEGGIYQYSKINNISKSALYRWIKIYAEKGELKVNRKSKKYSLGKKEKKESPFLPVIIKPEVEELAMKYSVQNKNLPESRWVAEIITHVIRGLL